MNGTALPGFDINQPRVRFFPMSADVLDHNLIRIQIRNDRYRWGDCTTRQADQHDRNEKTVEAGCRYHDF